MTKKTNLELLHDAVAKLLHDCLADIRRESTQASSQFVKRFCAAEYLLAEAQEYVDAAFALLQAEKPRASLAISRWVLEASLELLWATAEPNEVDDRLGLWVSETLRRHANCCDGLAEFFPKQAAEFTAEAEGARQESKRWNVQGQTFRPLRQRVELLKDRLEAKDIPNPYTLYQVCCEAAHPGLSIWRRLQPAPGGGMVAFPPRKCIMEATQIAAQSSFWLVAGTHCLTTTGDHAALITWWKQEAGPLLSRH